MKNLLTAIIFLGFSVGLTLTTETINAQNLQGDFSIGAGLVFGTGVFDGEFGDELNNDLGIQVNGYYSVTPEIRIGGDFTYYFPQDFSESGQDFSYTIEAAVSEININGHYLFVNEADLVVYALAGINITRVSIEERDIDEFFGIDESFSSSESETGLNLGAGLEYNLDFANFYAEAKLANLGGDANQFVLGAGLRFNL